MPNDFLSKANPALYLKEISDLYVKKNFQNLAEYFQKQNQLLNFKFLDLQFTQAETEKTIPHGLGVVPRDLLRLEVSGPGVVTFHRSQFNTQFLVVSCTGRARVRLMVGNYFGALVGPNTETDDDEVWFSDLGTSIFTDPSDSSSSVSISGSNGLNYSITAEVGGSSLLITLKGADGEEITENNPASVVFQDPTTGMAYSRSITVPITFRMTAGSTGGHVSGQNEYFYIYALDLGADTDFELALSGCRIWDPGSLQSTTAEGGVGGADTRTALYSATTRSSVPIALLGRIKSNQATAGTYITAISEISLFTGYQDNEQRSYIKTDTGNGNGSTATKIRKYTNTTVVGGEVTYNSGSLATSGMRFTAVRAGVYGLFLTDQSSSTSSSFGVSLSPGDSTTNVGAIATPPRLNMVSVGVADNQYAVSACLPLLPGEYLCCHTGQVAMTDADARVTALFTRLF